MRTKKVFKHFITSFCGNDIISQRDIRKKILYVFDGRLDKYWTRWLMIEGVSARDDKDFHAFCDFQMSHESIVELGIRYFSCNKVSTILVNYAGKYTEDII
jgi:hypothetical protein